MGTTSSSQGLEIGAVEVGDPGGVGLAGRPVGLVAGDALQGVADHDLAGEGEGDAAEPGDDADQDGGAEDAPLGAETPLAELEELGEPAERMGESGGSMGVVGHRPWVRGL